MVQPKTRPESVSPTANTAVASVSPSPPAPAGPAAEPEARILRRPQRTLWQDARRRFLRHRVGVLGLVTLVAFALLSVLAPVIAPYPFEAQDLSNQMGGPSAQHWLGTDELGRDVYTRLLYAARVTFLVAVVSTALAALLGVLVGAVGGFFGGRTEMVLMRLTDVMLSLPLLALLLVISKMLREMTFLRQTFGANNISIAVMIIILTVFGWMPLARIVHGSVLSLKGRDFVEAARALGAMPSRIIGHHLLPNTLAPIIVQSTLRFGTAVILEGTLSFLGLGITPPNPSLGNMLTEAQSYMFRNAWLAVYPGLVIFFVVLAINFVGDALRDALDPRMTL